MTMTISQRFWAKVERKSPDECWEWTASRSHDGYGFFGVNGRNLKANRVAWKLEHGEIPAGLCVLHSCDNPPCVNPGHLHLGTVASNNAEAVQRDRHSTGVRNGKAKLTVEDVKEIRRRRAAGALLREIAVEFGIHVSNVSFIARGVHWPSVPMEAQQ